jgi:hypothetical protein
MATCFADFLCFSEVLNVRLEDITLTGSDLRLRVKKAKNHRLNFDVSDSKGIGSFVLDFLRHGLKWKPGKRVFFVVTLRAASFGHNYRLVILHCTAAVRIL